jgi:predicted AAA+ superfamily ATPase
MNYCPRFIENKLLEYAKYFKVIQVTGARQVGKSTLLAHMFPQLKAVVFDPVRDEYGVRHDPDLFLDNFPAPLILDEVQYVPELLPALKRRVDQSPQKGQYFITGSQNFSVMKALSESLAGRVGILHLEGMTPDEQAATSDFSRNWLDYLFSEFEQMQGAFCGTDDSVVPLKDILWRGGMPGLLGLPDYMVKPYFDSYMQTYIERDVRLLESIKNLSDFSTFVALSAALSAQEINASQLGRDIGISSVTARKWYQILVDSYQCFELLPYHGNAIKRLSKKRKGYLTDTGLMCYLQYVSSAEALAVSPLFGACFETFVVGLIRKQLSASFVTPAMYHWRTAAGAEVDLVFEMDGKLYPVEIKAKSTVKGHDTRGIRAFRETYGERAQPGVIIYAGRDCYRINEHALAIPWNGHFK